MLGAAKNDGNLWVRKGESEGSSGASRNLRRKGTE